MFQIWRDDIEQKLEAMKNEVSARNKPEDYSKIAKRVMQFKNSIGSAETISKLCFKVSQRLEAPTQTVNFDI